MIGFTCSAFDLLHPGHIAMLRECKQHCDWLIVGLHVDPTIERVKAKQKPIQSVYERYVQLSGCKYVDEIIVYSTELELLEILCMLPIDIRILGSEYLGKQFTGHHLKSMDYYFNKRDHGFSTSELRKRIAKAENNK